MAAPTSRRGWPSGTVCLQVWNDSYNGMVLCRRDCKNACSLCPVSARHVYLGCRRTGCGLCWAAGLFCLIQRSVSLICSGWTPTNRRVASVSVRAEQTLRCTIPRHLRETWSAQTAKKPDHIGLFGNIVTQNSRPRPQEKSETNSCRIRVPTHVELPDSKA